MNIKNRLTSFFLLELFFLSSVAPPVFAQPGEASLPQAVPAVQVSAENGNEVIAEFTVTPGEGGVFHSPEVSMEIPSGAVDKTTTITVEKLSNVARLNSGMANVTSGASGFRFLPDGQTFSRAVKVSLPFDRQILESETALSNLHTWYYDEKAGKWNRLERFGIDQTAAVITSLTTHFTDMITSTLTLPEGPQAVEFNVNSIKDLKAADPTAEVPRIQGLKADTMGGAGFSLPLRIPKGRGAATPQLAVSYSSEQQNSWMGRGFNISVPSVSIDTRFGLPDYDTEDTFLLNGEELIFTGEMEDGAMKYIRRKEGSFERILWYVNDDRRWEVTDKGGTKRIYGTGDGWIGPDAGDRSRIYSWYLSRIIDSNGNTANYVYDKDLANKTAYLSDIRYSGHTGDGSTGLYRIHFDMDSSPEARPDRRSDARGKFVSKLTRLLQGVEVSYDGLMFRRYDFTYAQNIFGQTQLSELAESDGAGSDFYRYRFDYYEPEVQGDGYKGFGDGERSIALEDPARVPALQEERTSGVGVSLYTGIGLYGPKIDFFGGLKWERYAHFGLRAGANTSKARTELSLMDLTGDGLADVVLSRGKEAVCFPQDEGVFNTGGKAIDFGSLSRNVNEVRSSSYNFGLSAGVIPLSGSTTWQWGQSKTRSSFSDLNGDGFVDFAATDFDGYFLNNEGKGFISKIIETPSDGSEISEVSSKQGTSLEKGYFIQEPVRKWKAYRSGTVNVSNSFTPVETGFSSYCDAVAVVRAPGGIEAASDILSGGVSTNPLEIENLLINKGDPIYFHLDTKGDPRGDDIEWNSTIHYSSIKLLESMEELSTFVDIPLKTYSSLPDGDSGFEPLYTSSFEQIDEQNVRVYNRRSNWKALVEANPSLQDVLIRNCYLNFTRVPAVIFEPLLNLVSADYNISPVGFTYQISASDRYTLFYSFTYSPEENVYYCTDSAGLAVIRKYDDQWRALIGMDALRSLVYPEVEDLPQGYPDATGEFRLLTATVTDADLSPEIRLEGDWNGSEKVLLENGSFLLDQVFLEEDTQNPTCSYILHAGAEPHILKQGESGAAPAGTVSETGDGFHCEVAEDGVTRFFNLRGETSLLQSMPEALFEETVIPSVISGEQYGVSVLYPVSSTDWLTASAGLSEADLLSMTDSFEYDEISDTYMPKGPGFESGLLIYLQQTDALYDIPDSILDVIDPGIQGIILFSEDEYTNFLASQDVTIRNDIAELFVEYIDADLNNWYSLQQNLNVDQTALLATACGRYRAMDEVFPFYKDDNSNYVIKDILDNPEDTAVVISALSALGIRTWTQLERGIVYNSNGDFEVTDEGLVSETGLTSFSPLNPDALDADVSAGSCRLPVFDSGGKSINKKIIFRQADSFSDYSDVNLVDYSALDNLTLAKFPDSLPSSSEGDYLNNLSEKSYSRESFAGGVHGWFYGAWTGYYGWDAEKLAEVPEYEEGSGEVPSLEVLQSSDPVDPPWFLAMSPNYSEEDDSCKITEDGRVYKELVPENAWIGSNSSYSEAEWDETGTMVFNEYAFAPYLQEDRYHPARLGGDLYYSAPTSSTLSGQGQLGDLRKSKNDSVDINLSAFMNLIGGSWNTGDSWMYKDFIDINGDRYPDVVQFPSDGGTSVTVQYGSITSDNTFTLQSETGLSARLNYMTKSSNECYGFGSSPMAVIGGIMQTYKDGKVESNQITATDGSSGASISINGTTSSNIQNIGFRDVNGDGLPDQMERTGSGSSSVALNTGNGFDPQTQWNGGLDKVLLPEIFESQQESEGIEYGNAGSFGGSVSTGVTAGAIGFGASGSVTGSVNRTIYRMLDMNGDGLPDQVAKMPDEGFFEVCFNLGDTFAEEPVKIYRPDWAGVNFAGMMTASICNEITSAVRNFTGIDISALPDFSIDLGGIDFIDKFGAGLNPFNVDDTLEYSAGLSLGVNGTVTFQIPVLWLILFEMTPGISGSYVHTSTSLKFQDITGDGLPDHVLRVPGENRIRVMESALGTVGLLKTIHTPFGGSTELSYKRVGNTVEMPQSRWVPETITMKDGFEGDTDRPGAHEFVTGFEFEQGVYDRTERMFCGFKIVRTLRYENYDSEVPANTVMASVQEDTYAVDPAYDDNFFRRGLLIKRAVYDRHPLDPLALEYSESTMSYSYIPLASGSVVPRLVSETDTVFDPETGARLDKRMEYNLYDSFGNVRELTDAGLVDDPDDDMRAEISYADLDADAYLHAHPETILVYDSDGNLLRKRMGRYFSDTGNLRQLEQYYTRDDFTLHTLAYDEFGNLTSVLDPRGCETAVVYDSIVHTFPVTIGTGNSIISGTPGYSTTMQWDYKYGKELQLTDQNMNSQYREYDSFGRMARVRSPYEPDNGDMPAVAFQYRTESFPWTAVTVNKISHDTASSEDMLTATYADGLGRIIQTSKEGEVRDGNDTFYGWNCSGLIAQDGAGRTVKEGQTVFMETADSQPVSGGLNAVLPSLAGLSLPTIKSYDPMDRVIHIVFPEDPADPDDDAEMQMEYGIEGDTLRELTIDPKHNRTETLKNIRGQVAELRMLDSGSRLLKKAEYSYSPLGELEQSLEHQLETGLTYPVTYQYDLAGRRTSVESYDAGKIVFRYDDSGNLTEKIDSNLRASGRSIQYDYDGLNRLIKVNYPKTAATEYTYGGPGDTADNRAGRLINRSDASGTIEYAYGKLGEVSETIRTLNRLDQTLDSQTAVTSFVYDYLGRLEEISYPDGETVAYAYNTGGQVQSVTGTTKGQSTTYIEDIGYDTYGQRVYMKYGNSVETRYTYNPYRRWLDSIETGKEGATRRYQNISYSFDTVGNITGYTNDVYGYTTTQTYGYDALNQLTGADGTYRHHPDGMDVTTSIYSQDYVYDSLGNFLQKDSSQRYIPSTTPKGALNYEQDYTYYEGTPHRVQWIGNIYYSYDKNGNVIEERKGGPSAEAEAGESTLSVDGDLRSVNRGFALMRTEEDDQASTYCRTYTWDEENRLVGFDTTNTQVKYLYDADNMRTSKYNLSAGEETLYFDQFFQGVTEGSYFRQSKHIYLGESRIATRLSLEKDNVSGTNFDYERVNTYYYHPDHLGSAQFVTDHEGEKYEHLEYTPYGELWEEQTDPLADVIPFRFTGKEYDEETGLYYYGARYLDPKRGRWMSSDPAGIELGNPNRDGFSFVESLNWYSYVSNNPMMYVDPTGKESVDAAYAWLSSIRQGRHMNANSFSMEAYVNRELTRPLLDSPDVQAGYPTWKGHNEEGLPNEPGAQEGITWCNRLVLSCIYTIRWRWNNDYSGARYWIYECK